MPDTDGAPELVRQLFAQAFARDHGRPPTDDEVRHALTADSAEPEEEAAQGIGAPDLRASCLAAGAYRGMVDLVFGQLLAEGGHQRMRTPAASVTKWADNGFRPYVLTIAGTAGCGKSTAATLALARRLQQVNRTTQTTCLLTMVQLAELAASGYDDRMSAVSALYSVPLLVVENMWAKQDLNLRHASSLGSRLHDLLEHRSNNERPTLITTNESLEMLEQEWGAPLCSYMRKPRGYFYRADATDQRRYPKGDIRNRAAKQWSGIMPPASWARREQGK